MLQMQGNSGEYTSSNSFGLIVMLKMETVLQVTTKNALAASLKNLNGTATFEVSLGDTPSVRNFKIALYAAGIGFRIAVCLSGPNSELLHLTDNAVLQEADHTYIVQVSKKVLTCFHCGLPLVGDNIQVLAHKMVTFSGSPTQWISSAKNGNRRDLPSNSLFTFQHPLCALRLHPWGPHSKLALIKQKY